MPEAWEYDKRWYDRMVAWDLRRMWANRHVPWVRRECRESLRLLRKWRSA